MPIEQQPVRYLRTNERQGGEADVVVGPVATERVQVRPTVTVVQMGCVKKQYPQPRLTDGRPHLGRATEQVGDIGEKFAFARERSVIKEATVGGQENTDIGTELPQSKRQGTGDISEPTGLYERIDLGAYEENVHAAEFTSVRTIVPSRPPRCHLRIHRTDRDRLDDRYRSAYPRGRTRSCP